MPRRSSSGAGKAAASRGSRPASTSTVLRIIGGRHRGRTLEYSGDKITRPMKDDVRESLFNLVGGWMPDRWVVDLFAGTGAVGLEGISRGAAFATMVERHFPTARIIRENARTLGEEQLTEVQTSDAFFWTRQFMASPTPPVPCPWAVFICPPWPLFMHQKQDMLGLIEAWFQQLPPDSLMVVESHQDFRVDQLPDAPQWKTRLYAPAQISVYRPPGSNNAEAYEQLRADEEQAADQ